MGCTSSSPASTAVAKHPRRDDVEIIAPAATPAPASESSSPVSSFAPPAGPADALRGFDERVSSMDGLYGAGDESFECAICLDMLCEPLELPCSHVFCRACLVIDATRENRCPLCRCEIPATFDPRTAPVHKQLERVLRLSWAGEYAQRLQQKRARTIHLRVGNRFKVLCTKPRTAYRWTLFVESESGETFNMGANGKDLEHFVQKVRFQFIPQCRVLSCGSRPVADGDVMSEHFEAWHGPFELTATSWNTTATVHITVFWNDLVAQPPFVFEHTIDLSGVEQVDKGWLYSVDLGESSTDRLHENESQSGGESSPRSLPTPSWSISSASRTPSLGPKSLDLSCGARNSSNLPSTKPCRIRRLSVAASRARSSLRPRIPKLPW